MRELFILIAHLLVTLAKLGGRAVLAQWRRNHCGQTPVAHNEACAASCSESNLMGSAGVGCLCAFGFTQTPEQDGRDTQDLHAFAPSPSFSEPPIPSAL